MKTRSSFFSKAILCVLMAALTLVICFPVAAATNSTTVTTNVPESFPLLLELSGKGTVSISGVAYTKSGTVEVPRNSALELRITPDAENEIKSVVYNGFDYTKEAKNGKLTLPAITGEAKLCISFAETASIPATGDPYYFVVLYLAALMVISLMGIVAMLFPWRIKQRKCIRE